MTPRTECFFAHVRFTDEAPRIGSGERFVYLERAAKWTYFHCPVTFATARLPIDQADRLPTRRVDGINRAWRDRFRARVRDAFGRRPPARIARIVRRVSASRAKVTS